MAVVYPEKIAERYVNELHEAVTAMRIEPHIVGFLASNDKPSISYANATKKFFKDAGFDYDLRQVERLDLESEILKANDDPTIQGIFIYFPVFYNQEDTYLRNLVDFTKDVEAGSLYWTRKLSANDRSATEGDTQKKALSPCTPLAIIKILDELGEYGAGNDPMEGKVVTILNRSEVIGRPLALMFSNDGAKVHSFDEFGPLRFTKGLIEESDTTREAALKESDIVITGVPSKHFDKVKSSELRPDTVCINFSSYRNFEDDVGDYVRTFVPRVGPMTVAMCMRNTLRLINNFHQ